MNNLMAGNDNGESSGDHSSVGEASSQDTADTAASIVHGIIDLDPIEERFEGQFYNFVGRDVSKRIGGVMQKGFVASLNNVTQMFKIVYVNGYSEEMGLGILFRYLVPENPFQPSHAELQRKNGTDGVKGLPQTLPAEASNKIPQCAQEVLTPGGDLKTALQGAGVAPTQAGSSGHRLSRKRKSVSDEATSNVRLPENAHEDSAKRHN